MAATELPTFASFSGLRNDVPAERLGERDLASATNVDLDDSGGLSRRDGYTVAVAAPGAHSVWANRAGTMMLFVDEDLLNRIDAGSDVVDTIAVGLVPGMRMSYWEHAARVYHSNGLQSGVVENGAARNWGIAVPPPPALLASGGDLPAGVYQVAYTYLAGDGQESGCGAAQEITLPTGGGIAVGFEPSADPRVERCAVYCSTTNGELLYWAGEISNGTGAAVLGMNTLNLQRPLQTQFYGPPPAGQIVSYYGGRTLVAVDNLLFYSAPFGLELFKPTQHIAFPSRITLVAPTVDGIYVSDSASTYWVGGADIEGAEIRVRQDDAAVEGTLAYAPSGRVGELQGEIPVPMWLTANGVTIGAPGGSLSVLTEQYRFAAPARGAALFRKNGETYQYLASFQGD